MNTHENHMTSTLPIAPEVSLTVYSVVWPDTERLVRQCLVDEVEVMMARHRAAHTKRQDQMHIPFFQNWRNFAANAVKGLEQFGFEYPSAGSSEAIREIIHQALPLGQALIVFEGDYEGYEANAKTQATPVVKVPREGWREILDRWKIEGVPWGGNGAQWWISQPSAIDGNVWTEFQDWLKAVEQLPGIQVWVDLCYVGRARIENQINLESRAIAGIVFSLSKVMGAYYRRIGGCLSRQEVPGLWANGWFKNLDSLYLGERWLLLANDALVEGARYAGAQKIAMARALTALGGRQAWIDGGIEWKTSDVPLLMHASASGTPPVLQQGLWKLCQRGANGARLCLTPSLETILLVNASEGVSYVA